VDDAQPDLICVSHLWWDSVWQRPHQLLSRLARHYRVLWVEEPHIEVGPPGDGFVVVEERPNLSVARLVYRSDRATFRRWFDEKLARIGGAGLVMPGDLRETSLLFGSPVQARLERDVLAYLASRSRRPRVLWLYTPTVLSFVDLVEPDLVVCVIALDSLPRTTEDGRAEDFPVGHQGGWWRWASTARPRRGGDGSAGD